jgi:N-hydroxyarylamine O-acetyltransferase
VRLGAGVGRVEGREEMNVGEYLARIGVDEVSLDEAGLRRLQRQHLLHVPFENLDIHWGRKIVLDIDSFYRKIVWEKRGGFCYELNGLFGALLNELGFPTRMVSARVAGATTFGPEYDHMALISSIGEEEFLVDVGFGAFTTEPRRMVLDLEQEDPSGIYVIRQRDDGYMAIVNEETAEYIFTPVGRELGEFAEMCEFYQTSPESHFKQGKVCSILTEDGRKTLTDKKFMVTTRAEKKESDVGPEFDSLLEREFGIVR